MDWDSAYIESGGSETLMMRLREACADRDDIIASNASIERDARGIKLSFELDCGEHNCTEVRVRERL